MKGARQKLGRWGEKVARTRLEADGFQIVAQNWRWTQGEIDLVAFQGKTWHFIEVKTRRGVTKGTPEEAITHQKALRLIAGALAYLGAHDLEDVDWQIDLVAIELTPSGRLMRCELLPNIVTG